MWKCNNCKKQFKPYYSIKFLDKEKDKKFHKSCQKHGMGCPECFDINDMFYKLYWDRNQYDSRIHSSR